MLQIAKRKVDVDCMFSFSAFNMLYHSKHATNAYIVC